MERWRGGEVERWRDRDIEKEDMEGMEVEGMNEELRTSYQELQDCL